MKVLLFDIDGTLVNTGGTGKDAMNQAFEEIFGVPNGLDGILLAGQTDPKIMLDTFQKLGLKWDDHKMEEFRMRYFLGLEEEFQKPRPSRRIMPGFPQVLEKLSTLSKTHLGLLTGNWKRGAEIKLANFGLWNYFEFGAYGDDNLDRNKLVPYAIRRAAELFGSHPQNDRVYVIGDTPRDVQCARPHGATAIAVATGDYSVEVLRSEKPDYLFADLSNVDAFLRIFTNEHAA
jgi:phosphoglycolate phosphatase-like HAD superfamily hydrolase